MQKQLFGLLAGCLILGSLYAEAEQGPRLVTYRDTYILFAKYNPDPASLSDYSPRLARKVQNSEQAIDKLEAEFQFSGKLIVAENLLSKRDYFSLAYTQQSFWQVYNKPFSAPFRDTSYEPEIIYTWRPKQFSLAQDRWLLRAASIGLSHQANGSTDEFDRRWERIYLQLDTSYNDWLISFKPWLPFGPEVNNGGDFVDYYGYGELNLSYLFGDSQCNHRVSAMLRNNLKADNKGAVDLRFSYCFSPALSLYAKYFNGYGESMLDYNIHNQSFGLGLALNRIGDSREMMSNSSKWTYGGLSMFRDNYLLAFKYNANPAKPDLANGLRGKQPESSEVEFQISFRLTLPFHLFTDSDNLNFAYSQQTFWQAYQRSSDAIRETNYEPEFFYQWNATSAPELAPILQWLRVGFVHESNGQSELRSRSWNRLYAEFGFNAGPVEVALKPWYRLNEDADDDDNPNIEDYYGYGELSANWQLNPDHRLSVLARNNLKRDNKGAFDLRWAYRLTPEIALYMKYFNGYGESLIDYNKSNQSIGIGIAVNQ
jgi:phospholipase A1